MSNERERPASARNGRAVSTRSNVRAVGWLDPQRGLDNVRTIERYEWAAKDADRQVRHRTRAQRDAVLNDLLPLVDAGWSLRLLGFSLPKTDSTPHATARRAIRELGRSAALRGCTGVVFRHLGKRRGVDVHVLLACPPGALDRDRAKVRARHVIGWPDCWPDLNHLYSLHTGAKVFWPDLSLDERRNTLRRVLAYLLRQYLTSRRDSGWSKRVTQFRADVRMRAMAERNLAVPQSDSSPIEQSSAE